MYTEKLSFDDEMLVAWLTGYLEGQLAGNDGQRKHILMQAVSAYRNSGPQGRR